MLTDSLLGEYEDWFDGLGKLDGKLTIVLDKCVNLQSTHDGRLPVP